MFEELNVDQAIGLARDDLRRGVIVRKRSDDTGNMHLVIERLIAICEHQQHRIEKLEALLNDGRPVAVCRFADAQSDAAREALAMLKLEEATALAERYGEAIIQISEALTAENLRHSGRVMRARGIIVGLDESGNLPPADGTTGNEAQS